MRQSFDNTEHEIDVLVSGIGKVKEIFD